MLKRTVFDDQTNTSWNTIIRNNDSRNNLISGLGSIGDNEIRRSNPMSCLSSSDRIGNSKCTITKKKETSRAKKLTSSVSSNHGIGIIKNARNKKNKLRSRALLIAKIAC